MTNTPQDPTQGTTQTFNGLMPSNISQTIHNEAAVLRAEALSLASTASSDWSVDGLSAKAAEEQKYVQEHTADAESFLAKIPTPLVGSIRFAVKIALYPVKLLAVIPFGAIYKILHDFAEGATPVVPQTTVSSDNVNCVTQ